MADVHGGGLTSVPSLPPPVPRSPSEMPDFGGKRRRMAKVQKLEREIGILQEELEWIGELQPASKSCKEVADFVGTNADPLTPAEQRKKNGNSTSSFWGWLCGMACFNSPCPRCSCRSECYCHIKCPAFCTTCRTCSRPMFRCSTSCCSRECCISGLPSCGDCSGCGNSCSCFRCLKMGGGLCCRPCRNSCHNNSHSTPTSH